MSVLMAQEIIDKILERADADGVDAARDLYKQMMENEVIEKHKVKVDAGLLLEGRDELIVKY